MAYFYLWLDLGLEFMWNLKLSDYFNTIKFIGKCLQTGSHFIPMASQGHDLTPTGIYSYDGHIENNYGNDTVRGNCTCSGKAKSSKQLMSTLWPVHILLVPTCLHEILNEIFFFSAPSDFRSLCQNNKKSWEFQVQIINVAIIILKFSWLVPAHSLWK